ncbi:MAG: hypothetical protein E7167_01830 [Firmicutes bacterium]|nr:hypothetical protein [Bacillota bacterium]
MTKQTLYEYLGTNGVLLTPIHLEDVYYVRKIKLIADRNKGLIQKGSNNKPREIVIVPENELDLWIEVDCLGQE